MNKEATARRIDEIVELFVFYENEIGREMSPLFIDYEQIADKLKLDSIETLKIVYEMEQKDILKSCVLKNGSYTLNTNKFRSYQVRAFVRHGENILMLQTRNEGDSKRNGMWELPGGSFEENKDNTLEDCIARELKEETGLILFKEGYSKYDYIDEYSRFGSLVFPIKSGEKYSKVLFFYVQLKEDIKPVICLDIQEHSNYKWVPLENLFGTLLNQELFKTATPLSIRSIFNHLVNHKKLVKTLIPEGLLDTHAS